MVEGVDAGGGGDDIDDGVDCAYFVEVNFFDGDVVDFCFGGTEELEGLDGCLLDGGCERCGGLNEVADHGKRAAVGVFVIVGVVGWPVLCWCWVLGWCWWVWVC